MKNLNQLTLLKDTQLLSQLQVLASQERGLTVEILAHLREVEKRKLYVQKGYGSIIEYTVKELKYSDPAASRRVNAMRLLKGFDDVSDSMESGALNLSSMIAVQSFIKKDEKSRGKSYDPAEKRELLKVVENKSKRECEQLLAERMPIPPLPPKGKAKAKKEDSKPESSDIKILLSVPQRRKLEQVRELLTPQKKGSSYAELLELMADLLLEQNPVKSTQKKRAVNPQRKMRWKKKVRAKPQMRLLS